MSRRLQLIKTIKSGYKKKYQNPNTKKSYYKYTTFITKILKDEDTGEKFHEIIENPEFKYYLSKEELPHQVNLIKKEDVTEEVVRYDDLIYDIALKTEQDNYYRSCIAEGRIGLLKRIFLNKDVHSSDIDIEDYIISQHYNQYPITQSDNKLNKAFFDIEVDGYKHDGFPDAETAACPINAISWFNEQDMTLYGLFLRPEKPEDNPQVAEFEKPENLKKFIKRIKNKYKERGFDIKVKLVWYDYNDELNLIKGFYAMIHYLKPDIISAWNMTGYDKPYLINRIINLGGDPTSIMSCNEIKKDNIKLCKQYLNVDSRNQDPCERSSTFECTDYSIWYDSLLLYANLRKSSKKDSYALDNIAELELGEHKLSFKNPITTIKNSPYVDYDEFVEYNLHDTMLLFLLENKTKDCDMIYTVACKTETRILKALKKTICIKNLARKFYMDNGYVMSNNHNVSYGGTSNRTKVSFRGAFVADPLLNERLGEAINGIISNFIFNHVIDFDLKSLYPSIILAFNVDPTTEIGQVQPLDENDDLNPSEFADDIVAQDYIHIGNKYFGLPDIEEMLNIVDSKIN